MFFLPPLTSVTHLSARQFVGAVSGAGNLEGICSHSEGGQVRDPGVQHWDGLIRPEKIFDLYGAG